MAGAADAVSRVAPAAGDVRIGGLMTARASSSPHREVARRILTAEADAVRSVIDRLDESFDKAVELLAGCKGMVVIAGLGKSGFIGQKMSATLASIGTPSHFVHPTEAVHGDLGRIREHDVMILLSYGGETEEVLAAHNPARKETG